MPVVAGQMDHEGFLVAIEQAVNSSLGEILPRHRFAAVQIIRNMGLDEGNGDLQQRHIDKLANTGFGPCQERRHDAVGGENPCGVVDERDAGDLGVVEFGNQAHHAAQRLADGVKARFIAVGSALAIAGDRAMDQFGIQLRQLVVFEA